MLKKKLAQIRKEEEDKQEEKKGKTSVDEKVAHFAKQVELQRLKNKIAKLKEKK